MKNTEYMNTPEAAKLLNYDNLASFRRAVHRDGIPYIRVNARRMLFSRAAILTWIADRSVGGAR